MKVIKLFLLLFLFPQCYVLAQYPSPAGPFDYSPIPYELSNSIDKRTIAMLRSSIPMNGFAFYLGDNNLHWFEEIAQNDDCFMIEALFSINAATDNNKPLIALEYDTIRLLDIRYSDSTVVIKRYNHERMMDGVASSYDYKLFDPLFIPQTGGVNQWYMQLYFTSGFMLIVTTENANDYYMSPIYFGLDFKNMLTKDGNNQFIDNGSYMYKYLQKNPQAKIIVGDPLPASPYDPYVDNIWMYSLSYVSYPYDKSNRDSQDKRKNLWWHIQGNLSSPVDEPNN